jgi:hypothetical protein
MPQKGHLLTDVSEDISHCRASDRVVVFRDGSVSISDGEDEEIGDGVRDVLQGAFDSDFGAERGPFGPAGSGGGRRSSGDRMLDRLPSKLEITGETRGGGR